MTETKISICSNQIRVLSLPTPRVRLAEPERIKGIIDRALAAQSCQTCGACCRDLMNAVPIVHRKKEQTSNLVTAIMRKMGHVLASSKNPGKSHKFIPVDKDRACVLRTENGCSEHVSRPLACESYPFISFYDQTFARETLLPTSKHPILLHANCPPLRAVFDEGIAEIYVEEIVAYSGEGRTVNIPFLFSPLLSMLDAWEFHSSHERFDLLLVSDFLGYNAAKTSCAKPILGRKTLEQRPLFPLILTENVPGGAVQDFHVMGPNRK